MSSVSQEVKDSLELSKDSELNTYKRNPIEGSEKSDVSEDGILPELDSQLPELVN